MKVNDEAIKAKIREYRKDKVLKAFISLNESLTPLEILTQYIDHWAIELLFRDCKTYLGLD